MPERITETIIDMLTKDSVSVITKQYIEIDGVPYLLSKLRKAYDNSPVGREMIEDELSETDSQAIFSKWGDIATVESPIVTE